MAIYTCPTCNATMERDMVLFFKHTDKHIVDEIKKNHPSWITDDGYCPKCVNYYKQEMGKTRLFGVKKTTNPALVNIGVGGVRMRTVMGTIALVAAVCLYFIFRFQEAAREIRLVLFVPFFMAALGLIQAREQICVVYGSQGTMESGEGRKPVSDAAVAKALKNASRKILLFSLIVSSILTALALL